MLKTLQEITNRIVEFYQPERVILFGSYGTSPRRNESDIDLLIIKETEKRPLERRQEVEKILSDRLIPLDIIVYTSQEMKSLFSLGSPFIQEVLEKGKVLYMRNVTEGWIKDAEDELDSANILFQFQKYRGVCYLSQQCVWKASKTLIFKHMRKRPDRAIIQDEWISRVLQFPQKIEIQTDRRIRKWGWIPEEGKFLRVILLEDDETVHNAFLDRSFKGSQQ